MSFLSNLLGKGTSELLGGIDDIISRFKASPEEKSKAKIAFEELLQKRDQVIEESIQTEINARKSIIVAELQQGDNYTKRARPSVVYFGLLMIFLNYGITQIANIFGADVEPVPLPTEFWVAWGGICSTWVIGRTIERRGIKNKITSAITGSLL